jgi:hypothetical protein
VNIFSAQQSRKPLLIFNDDFDLPKVEEIAPRFQQPSHLTVDYLLLRGSMFSFKNENKYCFAFFSQMAKTPLSN